MKNCEIAFNRWINKKVEGLTALERCTKYLITPTEVELIKESLRYGFYAGFNNGYEYSGSSTVSPK